MALVTISSAYGALGSEVGHAVADELEVPFLDRAIPAGVAEQLDVPLEEAETRDEALSSFFERLLGTFMMMGGMYGGAILPASEVPDEAAFLAATEQTIRRHAACGSGVILGRGGMIVLAGQPHVVRVRLTGPLDARIAQAVRRYGFSEEEARRQQRQIDGARAAWVQRFYGRDVTDSTLYDLVVNATKFDVSVCVGLIVAAARAA